MAEFVVKHGIRHSDRLLKILLSLAEDDKQETKDRLDATEMAISILGRRKPFKRDPKKKAIERMLGKQSSQD